MDKDMEFCEYGNGDATGCGYFDPISDQRRKKRYQKQNKGKIITYADGSGRYPNTLDYGESDFAFGYACGYGLDTFCGFGDDINLGEKC